MMTFCIKGFHKLNTAQCIFNQVNYAMLTIAQQLFAFFSQYFKYPLHFLSFEDP